MVDDAHISALHTENRTFPPSLEFAQNANAREWIYEHANTSRVGFWEEQALHLHWDKPFTEALDWSDAPVARWFADGTLNACDNAVDRHVREGRGARVAFHWEGEPGDTQTITYADMLTRVSKAANALESLGITKRVFRRS